MTDNQGFFDQIEEEMNHLREYITVPQGMVLTCSEGGLSWIDPQPPRNTIHNAIKCDYCGSLHHDTRCPSCGAPAKTRIQ